MLNYKFYYYRVANIHADDQKEEWKSQLARLVGGIHNDKISDTCRKIIHLANTLKTISFLVVNSIKHFDSFNPTSSVFAVAAQTGE